MEVMLAEVMALNAYSGRCLVSGHDDSVQIETRWAGRDGIIDEWTIHTNLVQSTLVREDSDMSIIGASCGENQGQSGMKS